MGLDRMLSNKMRKNVRYSPFLAICLLIMIVSDSIIWIRLLLIPVEQRGGQLVGAIGCLVAAVAIAVALLY